MGYEHEGLRTGRTRFGWGAETGAIEQFTFEGGEEAFAMGIIKPIADRAHRGADASCKAAMTKGSGRVLAAMSGMVDDILGTALLDGHLPGSRTSSVRTYVAVAQPTTRRLQVSTTTARYRKNSKPEKCSKTKQPTRQVHAMLAF